MLQVKRPGELLTDGSGALACLKVATDVGVWLIAKSSTYLG
jgi:hypothetical protein